MDTCHQCAALAEELEQARAELAAATKDAERYAALKSTQTCFLLGDGGEGRWLEMDDYCDALLAQQAEKPATTTNKGKLHNDHESA